MKTAGHRTETVHLFSHNLPLRSSYVIVYSDFYKIISGNLEREIVIKLLKGARDQLMPAGYIRQISGPAHVLDVLESH